MEERVLTRRRGGEGTTLQGAYIYLEPPVVIGFGG